MSPAPQLRTALEVQKAHDLLTGILLDQEMRAKLGEDLVGSLVLMAGVLCWALHYDHIEDFAKTLLALEEWLRRWGIEMVDSGGLRPREDHVI